MSWLVLAATFLAAAVEWVEALTIVLAVGIYRGWRSALAGTAVAGLALLVLVAGFGSALTAHFSIGLARTAVGIFLLLFGVRWLHKAILRSAGLVALHDEAKAFDATREGLGGTADSGVAFDWRGTATSFNGVFLEGLEVVFIVIALGGLNQLPAAATGALASAAIVIAVGVLVRHPLTQVPENLMKYVVGIMLTAFGTFFAGEGVGVEWWRADLSLLPLIVIYALASVAIVAWLRRERGSGVQNRVLLAVKAAVMEVWGLFVNDSALALGTLTVVFALGLLLAHSPSLGLLAGVLMAAGVIMSIVAAVHGPASRRPRKEAPAATMEEASLMPQRERPS